MVHVLRVAGGSGVGVARGVASEMDKTATWLLNKQQDAHVIRWQFFACRNF